MNPNPNLPEEILVDIFTRLPTKSIGRCRCLSKPWRALLSTPNFIKSHLTHKTHKRNLLLISPSGALHTISAIKNNNETVSEKLNLSNTWSAVIGSCNGLVLLLNREEELFLVNPITREQVKIPASPLALPKQGTMKMHGFGYDSSTDDYKIVTLSHYDADIEYEPFRVDTLVDVYSVKLGVWRRLDSPSPYNHSIPFKRTSGAFVNGAIHSLALSSKPGYPSVITAFDLGREEFYEIPAPLDIKRHRFVFNDLVVLEGCLFMMDTSGFERTDFWMLKEYDKQESWTKFYVYALAEWEMTKPLCFVGEEEVLFVSEENGSHVYDFKDHGLTVMVVDGVSATFIDGETFTESLVSPFFGKEIGGGNI